MSETKEVKLCWTCKDYDKCYVKAQEKHIFLDIACATRCGSYDEDPKQMKLYIKENYSEKIL